MSFLSRYAARLYLRRLTFDQVVELYWECQALNAEEIERNAARLADPNDMFGKTFAPKEDHNEPEAKL